MCGHIIDFLVTQVTSPLLPARLIPSCSFSLWTQQAPGKQLQVTQMVCGQCQPGPACKGQPREPKTDSLRSSVSWPGRQRQAAGCPGAVVWSWREPAAGLQGSDRSRNTQLYSGDSICTWRGPPGPPAQQRSQHLNTDEELFNIKEENVKESSDLNEFSALEERIKI